MIKIEINGIDDFITFVTILRCQDMTPEQLKELADNLNVSSTNLDKAIRESRVRTMLSK